MMNQAFDVVVKTAANVGPLVGTRLGATSAFLLLPMIPTFASDNIVQRQVMCVPWSGFTFSDYSMFVTDLYGPKTSLAGVLLQFCNEGNFQSAVYNQTQGDYDLSAYAGILTDAANFGKYYAYLAVNMFDDDGSTVSQSNLLFEVVRWGMTPAPLTGLDPTLPEGTNISAYSGPAGSPTWNSQYVRVPTQPFGLKPLLLE